jgi:hypothetical protein
MLERTWITIPVSSQPSLATPRISSNRPILKFQICLVSLRGHTVAVFSKVARTVGTIIVVLIIGIIGLVLVLDPPPLRLQEETKFVLSVPAPKPASARDPLEMGIACDRKLEGYTGSLSGRPQITFFDWLKHQSGQPPEPDYHLYGVKMSDTWAFKIDRATKTLCYQKPRSVEVGITDPYCGPKITFENADRIIAIEDAHYDGVSTVLFNKRNFTLMMTQISVLEQLGASIEYFQCH